MNIFNKTWQHRRWLTKSWSWCTIGVIFTLERPHCTGTTYQADGWDMTSAVHVQLLGFHVSYHHTWKQEWLRSFRGEPKKRYVWAEAIAEYERAKEARDHAGT